MIINPIIPIWLMAIVCIGLIIWIIRNCKQTKKIKIVTVILLFVMNFRFMLPNGEAMTINSDISVLFVIDTSVSMRALDYNGNKERLEGVKKDCSHIIERLAGAKFSVITFGDEARRIMPFTTDSDMVEAEINALSLENDFYAKGTSINVVKSTLEKTLKDEAFRQNGASKFVVFFITDGEMTKEGETLGSFTGMTNFISNGAVLGYGTKEGGKMINGTYIDEPTSEYYYLYYYDDDYNMKTALSKIDENNLKKIASDMNLDYIQMSKTSNVDDKLKQIEKQMSDSKNTPEKITSYRDTYYYFAFPLVILLIIDFFIKKRKM